MLGRLFKQQQSPLPLPLNPPVHSQAAPKTAASSSNSYEDSYTREILYGSSTSSQIKPHAFSRRGFRLVVAQDGGNLRSKQVLFDSADRDSGAASASGSVSHSEAPSPSRPRSQQDQRSGVASALSSPTSPNVEDVTLTQSLSQLSFSRGQSPKNILSSKSFHNVSELNEYMFGRGLPSSESRTATKVHLLPQFNSVHGSFSAVLVTRLFSIPDAGSIVAESVQEVDPSWAPSPAYPIKEISYSFPSSLQAQTGGTPECGSPSLQMPTKYSVNSRFSIGIVIPYSAEQSVDEVVLQNWEVISQYLISLQKMVTKKLLAVISFSTVNGACPYLANRRVSFPSELLQADADLPRQLQKLYRLIHYNYNTPRLINSNSIMKYSAAHTESRFKALLVNWVLEVINWLEFKDGLNVTSGHPNFASNAHFHNNLHSHHSYAHGDPDGTPSNTFLASLFALLLPLRDSLSQKTGSDDKKGRKEITRVLIVTGNSMVAKKLIFILNGLIPDTQFEACINDDDYKRSLQLIKSNDNHPNDSDAKSTLSSQETFFNYSHSAMDRAKRVVTPLQDTMGSPVPEEKYRIPETSSTHVVQPIPIRKNRSTQESMGASSDDSLSVSVSSQKGWEVPGKSVAAAGVSVIDKPITEHSSHFTTSYNPTHVKPSMSHSSSMAQLSSSLNSSLSSSASNYSFSKLGSSFLDKWRNSFAGGHIYPQDYYHQEGFDAAPAFDLNKRPSFHSLHSQSPAVEQEEFQWEPPAPVTFRGKSRLSRAQSMLDLYNHTSSSDGHAPNSTDFPAINLKRTRTAMVVPLASDRASGLADFSNDVISKKCERISEAKISYRAFDDDTLEVEYVPGNTDKIYKLKPLSHNVAFVDEFRPEFTMQSCPISSKLESQVSTAMKNDLLFYSDCGHRQVLVRTVVVSLRAREIKVIEMNLGEKNDRSPSSHNANSWTAPTAGFMQSIGVTTPPSNSHSPPSSYFQPQGESGNLASQGHHNGYSGSPSDSRSYKTTIRKVFMPHRNSGDRDQISRIEQLLDRLTDIVSKINASCQEQAPESKMKHLSGQLVDTVRALVH